MNKKTNYIIIFSLLVVLTVGTIFTDYIKQLGTILADASVPNPGHSLSEIEGGQDLATKGYVDTAMTDTVRTSGDQIIGGIKTFSNTIVGTGIITNASGGTRPACNASTRGLMWYEFEYGSSEQDDNLYICRKFSNDTYAYTAVTADDITAWDCGDDFIDPRDSNIYPTVQIGTQCWMAKNLAYLPSVVGPGTGSETTPHYYVYDYTGTDVSAAKATTNYTTYGVLYNWPAATTICPIGWHLPTDAEQYTLENYLSTGTCNASRVNAWDCNPAGTALKAGGSSGFNALMSGFRNTNGSFYSLGSYTLFWSSSASSSSNAWSRFLSTSYSTVYRSNDNKAHGFSVRCLRD